MPGFEPHQHPRDPRDVTKTNSFSVISYKRFQPGALFPHAHFASLILRGRLVRAYWIFNVSSSSCTKPGKWKLSLIEGRAEDSTIIQIKYFPDVTEDFRDTGNSTSPPGPVYLLKVLIQRSTAPDYLATYEGLVLRKVENKGGVYTRVGVFATWRPYYGNRYNEVEKVSRFRERLRFFDTHQPQTITVI